MANLLTTLTHPSALTSRDTITSGAAPKTVIGSGTGTVYTVSANAISNVDVRDLIPLLEAGWSATLLATLTHPQVIQQHDLKTSGVIPAFVTGNLTGTVYPIGGLATPVNATHTSGAGTLTTATYFYRVTAVNAQGQETAASVETSLGITGPAGVNVNWGTVAGAVSYNIYGRTTGAEQKIGSVAAPTTTFLDGGSVTPAGAFPTSTPSTIISNVDVRDLLPLLQAGWG